MHIHIYIHIGKGKNLKGNVFGSKVYCKNFGRMWDYGSDLKECRLSLKGKGSP